MQAGKWKEMCIYIYSYSSATLIDNIYCNMPNISNTMAAGQLCEYFRSQGYILYR